VRTDLYPPIEPYASGMLPLDGRHHMYWEESGNPVGRPVVFLHGGPGAGASAVHRRFFDPAHYRIVIFDQRGAGRSQPLGELVDNATPYLIADMEALRTMLGIERWIVFGGSWGSTLALAYAVSHPEACEALVLRGIFLCRPHEIDWFVYGMRTFFPEVWEDFAAVVPEAQREDLLGAYYRLLTHPDPAVHMPAARAWSRYEGACSTLRPSTQTVAEFERDAVALGLARIEAHYFINDMFLPGDAILAHIDRIRHIPATIVQGRYDMVCPLATADELADAWREAEYTVIAEAGHSAFESEIRAALVATMERLRDKAAGSR